MPATKFRTNVKFASVSWDIPFTAAVAFTGCPYKFVQPGSVYGEVVPAAGVAACGILPIGIIQNAPAAGASAIVRVMGKSIVAACLGACNLQFGSWVTVASHAGASPTGGSGLAIARWAGSAVPSASVAGWLGYGEVYLLGPNFSTCVSSPC